MKAHQVFFFLLLALLPTQLGYHLWPSWAHVLGRRVDYLSPTLFLTDLLLVATVVSFLWETRLRVRIKSFIAPLGIAAFVAANILFASSPAVAAFKWVKAAELAVFFWYVVSSAPPFSRVVFPLALGVLYSSLLTIAQVATQHSLGFWILGERTFDAATPGIARTLAWGREILRPYATFPHPNVLGGFLASVLPLIVSALTHIRTPSAAKQNPRDTSMKLFYLATFVLGGVALMLTFGRSAIAAGIIASATWFFILKKQTRYIVPVCFAFAIVFILAFPFSPTEESVVVRGALNASARSLFSSSPLIGISLGNFLVRLPEALPSRQIYFLQPVHNMYLLLLAETGIVGVGLISFALLRFVRKTKNAWHNIHSPFFVSLLVLLLLGLVDHYPVTLQQGQILFVLVAALAARAITTSHKQTS